ncbi:methyl-CpG-binding domain-containing protein 5-like [Malania oleifera]|uniref:methyl-CpG-binding domain-containing protein 5-like n=1 Tax=Malania oleifera TaxID=397392 RepID=UPI0025AE7A46|nr:methyl-CpG-binding domain-containing protein 5-like [Malania oleifera]
MEAKNSTPPVDGNNTEARPEIQNNDQQPQMVTPLRTRRPQTEVFVYFANPFDFQLPSDWTVEVRRRPVGKYTGKLDKFFYEPKTGKQFRSLTSAWKRAYVQGNQNVPTRPNEHAKDSPNSKCKSKKKMKSLCFDYANPPEKITWALTNAEKDEWNPFVEETMVPDLIKAHWFATFVFIANGNGNASSSRANQC